MPDQDNTAAPQPYPQEVPNRVGVGPGPPRKWRSWRRDPHILSRMERVQAYKAMGWSHEEIARELEVDYETVKVDLRRLNERWKERIDEGADAIRQWLINDLEMIKERALGFAESDAEIEAAVVLGISPGTYACPGDGSHILGWHDVKKGRKTTRVPELCQREHTASVVARGSGASREVKFSGAKDRNLEVARKAAMDQAKILGVAVDKTELTGAVPVRVYIMEGDGSDDGGPELPPDGGATAG